MSEADEFQPRKNLHYGFPKIVKINKEFKDLKECQDIFDNLPEYEEGKNGFLDLTDEYLEGKIECVVPKKEGIVVSPRDHVTNKLIKKAYRKDLENGTSSYADIFWIVPYNLIIFRGSKETTKEALNRIKSIIPLEEKDYKMIKVEHDFLLWITWCLTIKGELSENLSVKKIDQGGTLNNDKNPTTAPRKIGVEYGTKANLSLPAIYGLVHSHNFSFLGGDFEFVGQDLTAILSADTNIFVYSSKGDLKNKKIYERYSLILPFIIELVDVIEYWEDLEDVTMKYPDENYMNALTKAFNDQVEECKEKLKILKDKYKLKRGEKK